MHRALAPSYCHQSHPSDQTMLLTQASAGPLVPSEHCGTQFTTCRAGPHPAAKVPTTPLNASHCTQPCCFLAFSKHDILLCASSLCASSSFCLECILFYQPLENSYASFNIRLKFHAPSEAFSACWRTITGMTTLSPALTSIYTESVLLLPLLGRSLCNIGIECWLWIQTVLGRNPRSAIYLRNLSEPWFL